MVEIPRLRGEARVCHAGERRHPGPAPVQNQRAWIPVFTGMTKTGVDFQSTNS